MTVDILKASGIPFRQGRFLNPPAETYGVYFDDHTVAGADPVHGAPQTIRHDVMVELYERQLDPTAEAALEAQLIERGLHYTKQAAYWLQNVQRYQVIYEFSYTEKRRA